MNEKPSFVLDIVNVNYIASTHNTFTERIYMLPRGML